MFDNFGTLWCFVFPGYYVEVSRPDTVNLSQEDMAVTMTTEILEGCEGTGIRAGIIGEIGCNWPLKGKWFYMVHLIGLHLISLCR